MASLHLNGRSENASCSSVCWNDLINVLLSDPENMVNSGMARPAGGTKLFKAMKSRTDCEEFQKILYRILSQ